MDLEFLCDAYHVDEETIIAICVLSQDNQFELTSLIHPDDEDFEVSEYCTELTGIAKADLLEMPYFEDIYDELIDNIAAEDEILVWGNSDLEAIYKASINIAGELEFNIIDFQDEFREYCGLGFRPGLKKVFDALTQDAELVHHDVRSDTVMLKEIHRLFHEDKKGVMRKVKNRLK